MKKIFTLFSALLLTVSMWGATDFDCTLTSGVTITDESYTINGKTTYQYRVEYTQQGYQLNGSQAGQTFGSVKATLVLLPKTASFVGTFSLENEMLDVNESNLYRSSWSPKNRYFMDYNTTKVTSISIEDNKDGTYTILGDLRSNPSGSTYYYYHYTVDDYDANTFTPTLNTKNYYSSESQMTSVTYTATEISCEKVGKTPIVLNLEDDNGAIMSLQFNESEFAIAEGTHSVNTSFDNGTIMASPGAIKGEMYPSFYKFDDYFGGTETTLFITGGSVNVSYNGDKSQITLSGSLTSAKGSTITLAEVTLDNPVKEKAPIPVNVTSIEAAYNNDYYDGDIFSLTIYGTYKIDLLLYIKDVEKSDFTVKSLDAYNSWIYEVGYVDVEASAVTITETSTNNFKLNATIYDKSGQKYTISDAAFTCQLPTPWDSEPAKKAAGITFNGNILYNTPSLTSGLVTLELGDANNNYVELAFPATKNDIPAGTYAINDTKTAGTILASAGMYEPSYFMDDYAKSYFLRSGALTVAYEDGKMKITGDAYTFRETKVTFNVAITSPYVKEATLDVTSITPVFDDDYITFSIAASGTGLLSGAALTINTTELVGEFGNAKIEFDDWYTWVGDYYTYTALDNTEANSIVVTQDGFNYTLAATVYGTNGCKYTINGSFVIAELDEEEDNSALLTAAMGQTVDLDINRPFASGMWQTICLPFDIANIAESPLAGATVKSVTNCVLEGETLLVYAEDVTSMTAGYPYLIMWESGAPFGSLTFEDATIAAAEGITSGNFVANMSIKHYEDVANKYMVVAENGLAPMGTEGSVKGFRAYFQINAPAGVAPRKFAFAKNGATGTETPAAAMKANKVLKNGQLMLLNGEKVYNAQAQELK